MEEKDILADVALVGSIICLLVGIVLLLADWAIVLGTHFEAGGRSFRFLGAVLEFIAWGLVGIAGMRIGRKEERAEEKRKSEIEAKRK
jgi:hypothetical protein